MAVYLVDGEVLLDGGSVATSEDCCCEECFGCDCLGGASVTADAQFVGTYGSTSDCCIMTFDYTVPIFTGTIGSCAPSGFEDLFCDDVNGLTCERVCDPAGTDTPRRIRTDWSFTFRCCPGSHHGTVALVVHSEPICCCVNSSFPTTCDECDEGHGGGNCGPLGLTIQEIFVPFSFGVNTYTTTIDVTDGDNPCHLQATITVTLTIS